MGTFLGILAGGISLYLIAMPLLKGRNGTEEPTTREIYQEGEETAFAVLAEIEYDYLMGKINERDYKVLKQKYKKQAIHLLKDENQNPDQGEDLEAQLARELEQELAMIRQKAKRKLN